MYEQLKCEGYNPWKIVDEITEIRIGQGYLYNGIKTMDSKVVQQLMDSAVTDDEKEFWTMIHAFLEK